MLKPSNAFRVLFFFASLTLVAACQKQGGKRASLRDRAARIDKGTAQQGTAPALSKTTVEDLAKGDGASTPAKDPKGLGQVCGTDAITETCDAVLVVNADGEVRVLGDEGSIYNQNTGMHMTVANDVATATVDRRDLVTTAEPFVILLSNTATPLGLSASEQTQVHVLQVDAQFTGLLEKIAALNVQPGAGVILGSTQNNIPDALKAELENRTGARLQVVTDKAQLQSLQASARALAASYLAQLTYTIVLPSAQSTQDKDVAVTFNGQELSSEQFTSSITTSPTAVKIQIKDLQLFTGPSYTVTAKLVEKSE